MKSSFYVIRIFANISKLNTQTNIKNITSIPNPFMGKVIRRTENTLIDLKKILNKRIQELRVDLKTD